MAESIAKGGSNMGKEEHGTILYQHYSERLGQLDLLVKRRTRNVWAVLDLLALLAASGVDREGATSVLKTLSVSGFEFDLAALDPHFINSFIWLAFAGCVMLLYDKTYVIEFHADYLKDLEERMAGALQGLEIDLQRRTRPAELGYALGFTFKMYGSVLFFILIVKIGLEVWYLGNMIFGGTLSAPALFVALDCMVFGIFCSQTRRFAMWIREKERKRVRA